MSSITQKAGAPGIKLLFLAGAWAGIAHASDAAAQAVPACRSGLVPVPDMPIGTVPTGPVRIKCVTPQEAMQIMVSAQQEMMKKLGGGAQQRGVAAAPARTNNARVTTSALPGAGHQPASDPVLESTESIAAKLESGRLILRAVRFSPDGSTMTVPDESAIARIAHAMTAAKGVFVVEAHVPMNGAAWSTARSVSAREAEAVRRALVKAGVPVARMAAVGYGAARPEAADDTNPRVEIVRIQ